MHTHALRASIAAALAQLRASMDPAAFEVSGSYIMHLIMLTLTCFLTPTQALFGTVDPAIAQQFHEAMALREGDRM